MTDTISRMRLAGADDPPGKPVLRPLPRLDVEQARQFVETHTLLCRQPHHSKGGGSRRL